MKAFDVYLIVAGSIVLIVTVRIAWRYWRRRN